MLTILRLYLAFEVEGILFDDIGGNGMGIPIGDGEGKVTSSFLDMFGGDSFFEHVGDVGMAKRVEGQGF